MDTDLQDGEGYSEDSYLRTGYTDLGRKSDELLKAFIDEFPSTGNLPNYWRYDSVADFLSTYAHLGILLWAPSRSSHLLMVNGQHALRIWTDGSRACWVDSYPHMFGSKFSPENIPVKNWKKSRPFTVRTKVTTPEQMKLLAGKIKEVYRV